MNYQDAEEAFMQMAKSEDLEVRRHAYQALTELAVLREFRVGLETRTHPLAEDLQEARRREAQLAHELQAAYQNLTATQQRCTALLNENRELRRQMRDRA